MVTGAMVTRRRSAITAAVIFSLSYFASVAQYCCSLMMAVSMSLDKLSIEEVGEYLTDQGIPTSIIESLSGLSSA